MKVKETLTVEELAKILHVTPNTIQSRRWQKRSKCPLYRRGKRIFAISSEFWNWFKEGSVE